MPVTEIKIANGALYQIGDLAITSFLDGTNRANVCDAFYDIARDATLEEHPWKFAEKRKELGQIALEFPVWEYSYFYQLPSDFIRVRKINNDADVEYPYRVEGNRLLCDLSSVSLLYTYRVEDTSLFSPLFIEALIYKLAAWIAMPLKKDKNLKESLLQSYDLALQKAKGVDAVSSGTPPKFIQDDLTIVR